MSDSDAASNREMSEPEDDDDHDLVGGDDADERSEAEDVVPPPEPEANEGNDSLFVMYNRQYYVLRKMVGGKPGFQRCYHRIVKVKDGKMLGGMVAGPEGWPKGEGLSKMVSADKIVVAYGKIKEDDQELSAVWYLLIEPEGTSNKQDHLILRHIPKPVYKELIDAIKNDASMAESSLLRMQATGDNAKALNPAINGLIKVTGDQAPKTACIMPEKPKAEKSKGESSAKGKKADSKKTDAADDKKDDKAEDKKEEKKEAPKKSVDSFWKPKPPADKGDKGDKGDDKSKAGKDGPVNEGREEKKEKKEEEKKEAKATSAAPVVPPAGKRPAENGGKDGKVQYKKRRTESVESYEFHICDPVASVDFCVPEGATSGKVVFTWSFE